MAGNQPSDSRIAEELGADTNLELSDFALQLEGSGSRSIPGSSPRVTRSGKEIKAPISTPRPKQSRQPPQLVPSPSTHPSPQKPSLTPSKPLRAEPKRTSQIRKLSSSMQNHSDDRDVQIPDADIATTRDFDMASARSSRLEEEMEANKEEIGMAVSRIQALEAENSLLVGKINVLANELTAIKETISGPLPERSTKTAKTSYSMAPPPKPSQSSTPQNPLHPAPSSRMPVQSDNNDKSNIALGRKPMPKRKDVG